jgi:peptidoglycan/LPS O-acetylase OafA/YrhL
LMVFGVHLFDSFNTHFFPDCELLNAAMPFIKRFGTFGVELFFMISGYVIMNSLQRHGLQEFLARRFVRIYPMFAFFTLSFFILNQFMQLYPGSLSFKALLSNLTFLNIYFGTEALSPNAWSLTFEANFYVIAALSCFLLRKHAVFLLVVLSAACLAFVVYFPIAIYFVIGCLVYGGRRFQSAALPRSVELVVFTAWLILAATVDRTALSAANVALLGTSALFFFIVTGPEGTLTQIGARNEVFFIGTISYSFYLAHPYAYFSLRMLFEKVSLGTWNIWIAGAVYFTCISAAAVALSYLTYVTMEVAPYRALFGETIFRSAGRGAPRRVSAIPVSTTG